MWGRGKILRTNYTKRWTVEQFDEANKIEQAQIYANFHTSDSGRSRELICTMNKFSKDYESNTELLLNAINRLHTPVVIGVLQTHIFMGIVNNLPCVVVFKVGAGMEILSKATQPNCDYWVFSGLLHGKFLHFVFENLGGLGFTIRIDISQEQIQKLNSLHPCKNGLMSSTSFIEHCEIKDAE